MDRSCGYCRQVLAALEPLELEVELRDLAVQPAARAELIEARGRATVPVLRIEREGHDSVWMPESLDIIRELRGLAGVESRVPKWVDQAARVIGLLGIMVMVSSLLVSSPAAKVLLWTGLAMVALGKLRRVLR